MKNTYDRCLDVMCDIAQKTLRTYNLDNDMSFATRIDRACRIAAGDLSDLQAYERQNAIEQYQIRLEEICQNQ